MRVLSDQEDVLGFCTECIRVRWLREVHKEEPSPVGRCRQCVREETEAKVEEGKRLLAEDEAEYGPVPEAVKSEAWRKWPKL